MRNRVLVVVMAVAICLTLIGCNSMRFDQTTNKNNLLTEKYSIAQIEELKNTAEAGGMTFSDFKRCFNVQCIRKTHQGYYVVLLLENEGNVFVFFNEENSLIHVLSLTEFKRRTDFQNQVEKQMTESEVLHLDPNAIPLPVSALDVTAHIVQEGIFIVEYSRIRDGELLEDPIVSSIQFIENETVLTSEDPFIRYEIPFIFELDKVS